MDKFASTSDAYPLLDTRQDNTRSLVTILAIMAFLASLALIFALSTQRLKTNWQKNLGQNATVQIMVEDPLMKDLKIISALAVLKTEFPDANIKPLDQSDSQALLKPWLGSVTLPDDLPIPSLISLTFKKQNTLDISALKSKLSAEGIMAEIDNHTRWSDQISRTSNGLLTYSITLLSLIFIACSAVSVFATQAALSAQKDVIRVLVQVGATDRFITKLFIKQAGNRGLTSAFIGVMIGAIISFIFFIRHNEATSFLPELSMKFTDLFYLILLALSLTLICALSAGLTSMRLLQREHRQS